MKLAYDTKLCRPGCVLIAAGLGADTALTNEFDSRHWIVNMTPDMKVYDVPDKATLQRIIDITEMRNPA